MLKSIGFLNLLFFVLFSVQAQPALSDEFDALQIDEGLKECIQECADNTSKGMKVCAKKYSECVDSLPDPKRNCYEERIECFKEEGVREGELEELNECIVDCMEDHTTIMSVY